MLTTRRVPVVVVIALLTACSGGGGDGAESPGSDAVDSAPGTEQPDSIASTAEDTVAPAVAETIAETTTTEAPVPQVPAGMQYGEPTSLAGTPRLLAVDGDTWLIVGTTPTTDEFCQPTPPTQSCHLVDDPIALVGSPSTGFEEIRIDRTASYPPVPGFGTLRSFDPTAAVKGPQGWVVTGTIAALPSNSDVYVHSQRGVVWFSPDARTWERIDLRDVVGADNELTVDSVIANGDGYLAVGSIAPQGFDQTSNSRGIVLSSPDGRTWTTTAELPTTFDSLATGIHPLGSQLVISGEEWVCGNVSLLFSGPYGPDRRQVLWTSADGGTSWTRVDLTGVEMFAEPASTPAAPEQCPDSRGSLPEPVDTRVGFIDVAGDTLVIGSRDGATVLASEDLATWRSASLTGGETNDAARRQVVVDGEDLVIVGPDRPFSPWEGSTRRLPTGVRNFAWRSTDGGATWAAIEGPHPESADELPTIYPQPDGSVIALSDSNVSVSTAGPLEAPPPCTLETGGSCTFTLIDGADLSAQSLAFVDLTGSLIRNSNLAAADLSNAVLAGTEFADSDLTGAILAAANLTDSIVDGSFRDVDMSYVDLTRSHFTGADLTGANFAGATLAREGERGPTFLAEVICPDGQPRGEPDRYIAEAESCRIVT